jgi:AAA+ ATPase superfamily predicted ATPase
MEIIGRIREQKAMYEYLNSDMPEFVAVYGRRRVGKTFLIKEIFKNQFTFYLTGIANAGTKKQLQNFHISLQKYAGKISYPLANNWLEAFQQLIHLVESSKKSKKVIFIDELPWLDTSRSGFISALEHFWNSWASSRPDILLIVCGSATSWMINKLIKNRGGLHNRVTRRMLIEPFNLGECEEFYQQKRIDMNRYQIVESYMITGGVPYYLSLMKKGLSLAQNVDALCFSKTGELKEEFSIIYNSLFKHSENHIKIVQALAQKNKGLTREEIIALTKLPDGGGLSKTLEELELCGFILKYNAFDKKNKGGLYRLIDFYSLFYLTYIRRHKHGSEHFWTNFTDNAKHRAWSGYAFEQVCLAHTKQIKKKLGITGVFTTTASWISQKSDPGAQVDLLIDRNDHVINLCEMKYAQTEFTIDKKYEENLRNKKAAFIYETKTRKSVHLTLVTTYGVKRNEYSGIVQSEVRMEDLFEK